MKSYRVLSSILLLIMLGVLFLSSSMAQASEPQLAKGTVFLDKDGDGVRDSGERGIRKVAVSNGVDVVLTDAKGRYEIPVTDDTIIFVIKPRGYMTPVDEDNKAQFYYVHKPGGSPPLHFGGVGPTGPLPAAIDFPLRKQHEPKKFKVLLFGDTQVTRPKDIDYFAHDVVEELVGTDAAFGISLGDIVHDNLSLMPGLAEAIGHIGIPWYYAPGNHDINFDATEDKYSDETYERVFGPPWYAFNYGDVHFIAFDTIVHDGEMKYHEELVPDLLTFIENDLALVPKDKLVVMVMHAPLAGKPRGKGKLFELLRDYPNTLSAGGHWHGLLNLFLAEESGWLQEKPHHVLVAGAACGSLYVREEFKDGEGIPLATMGDGTPNGYPIVTFDGNEYSYQYKSARLPADHQMRINAPESVQAKDAHKTAVTANVFASSEKSTVEIRLGEDGDWIPMQLVKNPGHNWTANLPANPPKGSQVIHVRTTDMFGQVFEDYRVIRVE